MTDPPNDFRRLEELFHQLVDLTKSDQEEALRQLEEEAAHLVGPLRSMLASDSKHTVAIDSAGASEPDATQRVDGLPESIGPYRVVRRLGEGGMGVVYEGELSGPLRRRVAIKVVKWGSDSLEVLRRFEIEQQALARLEHEGIARVYEAGVADDRPWFAMEYVAGQPITDYADRRQLDTNARVELFAEVCQAVQHAHQRGVIHRDLKPNNILIAEREGRRQPKIIDFGIAKATDIEGLGKTVFTRVGQIIGTPEYMSPEQAGHGSDEIDTRSDVYSLGVVLYELLVGRLPIDSLELRQGGFEAMRRMICELETPKPSSRLERAPSSATDAARNRRTTRSSLLRALRGELDWIVLRAMEKDPERRYGSPRELALDLERHLRGDVIEAGPPTFRYRARKFAARNRLALTITAVIGLALVATSVVSLVALKKTQRAEDLARIEAETSNRVTSFLIDLFETNAPGPADAGSLTARDILDRGASKIETELDSEPLIRARILETLGHIYGRLGEFEDARSMLLEGLALHEGQLGKDHPRVAGNLSRLGFLEVNDFDRPEEAAPLLERAVSILEDQPVRSPRQSVELVEALSQLSFAHQRALAYELAEEDLDLADAYSISEIGERSQERAEVLNRRGILLQSQGRYQDSLEPFLLARELALENLGRDHYDVALIGTSLAWSYVQLGRPAEAAALFEAEIAIARRQFGERHPTIADSLLMLAQARTLTADYSLARRDLDQALSIYEESYGADHYSLTEVLYRSAELEVFAGESAVAYTAFLNVKRRLETSDHPRAPLAMVRTLEWLSHLERHRARLDLASRSCELAVSIKNDELPEREWTDCSLQLALISHLEGDPNTAQQQFDAALVGKSNLWAMDRPFDPMSRVAYWAWTGQQDLAFAALEVGLEHGLLHPWALENPDLARLRGDPRFDDYAQTLRRALFGDE